MTIPQALQIALQHHQAGRLAEAEAIYRQVLGVQRNNPDALYLFGMLAHESGRHDEAADSIRQAIASNPASSRYRLDLGNALLAGGHLDEAIDAYQAFLRFKPEFAMGYNNLAALQAKGLFHEAVRTFRRALQIDPRHAETWYNLGIALSGQDHLDEAIEAYRRALELRSDYAEAHFNLGNVLHKQGQRDEAIAAYRRALQFKPDFVEAHNNLGNALRELGQLEQSAAAFYLALQLKPHSPEAHNNLGGPLRDLGELDQAIATFRHALQIKPDNPDFHSNLIFALHFQSNLDSASIAKEHRRWNRQFSDPLKPFLQPHANDRHPERPLRIGYVSPDFLDHPVGRFALPLLERHDREQFEIRCYSGVARPDWMTERLRASAGGWRNTVGVSDARLAETIREDAVDILVDLSLHTAGNRLTTFARRPAPVQVSWLAYPGSTGLDSIGYRLTDAYMDPPGSRSRGPAWSSEEPIRLPECWCCYDPAGESPDISELPALSSGCVTFGSLNNFAKVNEAVLTLWARVLGAVEPSRLIMLCPEGQTRERVLAFFAARGIVADRVEFARLQERREYLKLYQRIDLALDPFPVNGMTTTCDALWMGVPVLTLPGEMPVSRAGLSLLSCVGLGEFAVSSEDHYMRIAEELARDLPRLARLRATLRHRMETSVLMDAPRFAQQVEQAYREMWRRWCSANPIPTRAS